MTNKSRLFNKKRLEITINRLCHQLIENHNNFENTVLIGLQPRGIYFSNRIEKNLNKILGKKINSGIKCHWRFKLSEDLINWDDLIKGNVKFDPKNLSDPILIREDGSLLYHLPSVIDDIEEDIHRKLDQFNATKKSKVE